TETKKCRAKPCILKEFRDKPLDLQRAEWAASAPPLTLSASSGLYPPFILWWGTVSGTFCRDKSKKQLFFRRDRKPSHGAGRLAVQALRRPLRLMIGPDKSTSRSWQIGVVMRLSRYFLPVLKE